MEPASIQLSQSEIASLSPNSLINVNIGILGHVDSGKTSLVKALTKVPSTASLDKNPQSQQRGITLDLGFSCLMLRSAKIPKDKVLQITLVDCPGHASLIRTIIGGASIIDMMILVIDINKGVQTQTAECLVIGELLIPKMIIVLNKIDLIPQAERSSLLEKKIGALRKIFSKSKFAKNLIFVPISANIGGQENRQINETMGVEGLLDVLVNEIELPQRTQKNDDFLFLIDHCFPIKGQGSVVTGTVIKGQVKNNDEIEFPQISEKKKVKSIQMFHKPIDRVFQGDRAGLLFTNLESKSIERGIACTPGTLKTSDSLIISIYKIPYFKQTIKTKAKFHLTLAHQTVMGTLLLFVPKSPLDKFDLEAEYLYLDELPLEQKEKFPIFAALKLEKPLILPPGFVLLGSRLDSDINSNTCRLAFQGRVENINPPLIKILKEKQRIGNVEKIMDNHTLLVRGLFKKETNVALFVGKTVKVLGFEGRILGGFGQSGKVRIGFEQDLLGFEGAEEIKEDEKREKLSKAEVVFGYNKSVNMEKFLQ